jgi:release factor glutamine methyltransferase
MSEYVPTLTAEEVERLRRWHENAYQAMKAEGEGGQSFDYLGLTLAVPQQVQPITGMSHLLGEAVLAEAREDDRVLDMGTGSGVNALLAARTARSVLAVDINPVAVEIARANANANGVADRVEVRKSDVFGAVEGRFDLIVFDPPFRWFAPRDLLEAATADEGYRALTAFFHEAHGHLARDARMLISFGTTGDIGYLRALMDRHGFRAEEVARRELLREDQSVEYFVFRVRLHSDTGV